MVPSAHGQMYMQAVHTMEMIRALTHTRRSMTMTHRTVRYGLPVWSRSSCTLGRSRTSCAAVPVTCPKASDFSAFDFVPDWQATPADAAARLAGYWPTASQQIAHFSRQRLQLVEDPAELTYVDTTRVALQAMVDDADAVWTALSRRGTADVARRRPLRSARKRQGPWPRLAEGG